ncbi:MAG: ABC transporter ATP-binding protein [Planctomycetes bacterium]|nr:ABC transporter ATP-binding protein [Planctomycetota bacterium]
MKRFLPYYALLKDNKKPFILAILCAVVYAATSGFGLPFLLHKILPVLFSGNSAERGIWTLIIAAAWLPFMMGIKGLSGYANTYLVNFCGVRVLEGIRVMVFEKLQSLPLAYFQKQKSGDLLSRLMVDANQVRVVVVNVSNDLVKQPLQLVGGVVALIYLSYEQNEIIFILILLALVPMCMLPVRIVSRRLLKKATLFQEATGDMTASVSDSLQAPREIRAFNMQKSEVKRFQGESRELFNRNMKVVKYMNILSPTNEFIGACGVGAAIAYVGINDMRFDEIVPLLFALHFAYEPIKKIGNAINEIHNGFASLDRLEAILNTPDTLPDPEEPKDVPAQADISFSGVEFAYDDTPVLRDCNLTIKPGEIVALVGPSGAGKSTFAHLLPRFYDPTAGEVKVGDIPLGQFRKHDLRNRFAIVSQDSILFNDTVAGNILVGRPGASREEIELAAQKAYAHNFIMELDEGYETKVGEKGTRLSGGQKQRIALARAFLRDAPILILDEATSALDSESEAVIQKALEELLKGKTAFIIAHRFSTIGFASRILVFNQGHIIADGEHAKVYEDCRIYRDLYDMQMGEEGEGEEVIAAD